MSHCFVTYTQAADDEIQIFVPGASKRESTENASVASDISMPMVNSTPDDGAIDEVPCITELHNTSLDISITPKAAALCDDDDVCSNTLVNESASAVNTEDVSSDVQPVLPGSGIEDVTNEVEPVSAVCGIEAVSSDLQPDSLGSGIEAVSSDVKPESPVCGVEAVTNDVKPVCGVEDVTNDVKPVCGVEDVSNDVKPVSPDSVVEAVTMDEQLDDVSDDKFFTASEGESLPLLLFITCKQDHRCHVSCDNCLGDKREDYQNCSVLYCVPQLYMVITYMNSYC